MKLMRSIRMYIGVIGVFLFAFISFAVAVQLPDGSNGIIAMVIAYLCFIAGIVCVVNVKNRGNGILAGIVFIAIAILEFREPAIIHNPALVMIFFIVLLCAGIFLIINSIFIEKSVKNEPARH